MTTDDINREIIALWSKQFGSADREVRWPLICPEPIQNGLTVVGCNPALPKSGYYKVPIFLPDSTTDQQIGILAAHDADARKKYHYYKPSIRLARDLGLELEHVDLFFYRESEQEKLLRLIHKTDECLNDFGKRQVELAVHLIALSRPKIILVANAFAARIFKEYFGLRELDDEGLHWVELDGYRTPVFLSGMLSGGHLDNHTPERLVWHMRRTLVANQLDLRTLNTHNK